MVDETFKGIGAPFSSHDALGGPRQQALKSQSGINDHKAAFMKRLLLK